MNKEADKSAKRDKIIYLASSMEPEFREKIGKAAEILRDEFREVYVPMENVVNNAWDYPNNEWGLIVFSNDIAAIDRCDYVVFLNHGRKRTTAGCAWEAGYAFATSKKVFVVDVCEDINLEAEKRIREGKPYEPFVTSLMIENGRYATIEGLDGLAEYDWDSLPKTRTVFEQK